MRTATDRTGVAPPRRVTAPRLRSLAITVVGAVMVGVLAGWATYLVMTPETTFAPSEIASIRSAEMVDHYRAQWLDSPQGIAYLRATELPERHADAWLTPQRIAEARAADLVAYFERTYEPSP